MAAQVAGRSLGEQRRQVARQPGQDDLGLGVTEAHVVLEHLGPVGRQHEPGVQDTPVVDALGPQGGEGRCHRARHHRLDNVVTGHGHRRVRTHATGVGAGVAVAGPLEVLGRGQGHGACAVAHRKDREFGAQETLLDHHRAAGVPEGVTRQLGPHVLGRFVERLGDEDALAGGQAVCLHHVRTGQRLEELERGADLGERAVPRRRHTRVGQHLLHPRLRAFEPGAVGAGTEHESSAFPQPVGQPVDEGRLRPDHVEIGVDLLGRRRRRSRDAGVAGRDDDVGGARQHMGEGVLPPARPDDTNPHAASVTVCSRPGPTPT